MSILGRVQDYYDEKLRTHGPTALGVDWKSSESQYLRFAQLLKLIDNERSFTLIDYGCGYGALADYLDNAGYQCDYTGFDISTQMIARARELHRGSSRFNFVNGKDELRQADYAVASGIFNVKLTIPDTEWKEYMLGELDTLNSLSDHGFAINALTKYSDTERLRSDLYYADPLFLFDYCKKRYSKSVSLLHDYPLYEFTLLVRKA